jgi:hypothetical protein
MNYRGWLIQYGVAIVLALALSTLLGSLSLFKGASIGHTQLTASRIVLFLGYGSALMLLWLCGQRMLLDLPESGKGPSIARHMITPVITLILMVSGYKVLLVIGEPILDATSRTIYNWLFVAGTIGAAIWVGLAWFLKVAPLMKSWNLLGQEGKSI